MFIHLGGLELRTVTLDVYDMQTAAVLLKMTVDFL